jgi:hypothetical protein
MPILIVRRGLGPFFYKSLVAFAKDRDVTLVLDRRQEDRRRGRRRVDIDRRLGDRRGTPPPSWDRADFIVVPDSSA